MKIYSEPELRGLLYASAEEIHGKWYFTDAAHGPQYGHTEADALKIVDACLYLGAPVTDRVTISAWTHLIEKVRKLEDQRDQS